ncbi:DotA/TraY family protein [Pantoea agglomerans]|uniref:DotA/TraY family protein n=1 Tax=Enterobacter agglomerans TaxID=549 RepID=UPI000E02BE83|nr:DotA/TraY family protein [Pantoea agglomerans]SUC48988.1 Uncharacterised protein [Pantoea agglomerans]
MKTKKLYLLLIMLCEFLFFSFPAKAADGTFFEVADDDKFNQYFFKPFFEQGNFGSLLEIVSTAVLVFSGLIFVYNAINLVERTAAADSNKLLVSRWYWARLPLAVALMMPIPGGSMPGLSTGQLGVIWFAKQGIGAATTVYYKVAGDAFENTLYFPPDLTKNIEQLAYGMLINSACVIGGNNFINQTDTDNDGHWYSFKNTQYQSVKSFAIETIDKKSFTGNRILGYNYRAIPTSSIFQSREFEYGFCGTVTFETAGENSVSDLFTSYTGKMVNMTKGVQNLESVQMENMGKLQNEMFALAQSYIAKKESANSIASKIHAAALEYQESLQTNGVVAFDKAVNKEFISNMRKDGILFFGAYPMQIATAGDQVSSAISKIPVVSMPKNSFKDNSYGDTKNLLENLQNMAKVGMLENSSGLMSNSDNNSTIMGKVISWFVQDIGLGIGNDKGALKNKNMLVGDKAFGNKLITGSWASLTAGLGFAAAGGVAAGNVASSLAGGDTAFIAVMSLLAAPLFLLFILFMTCGVVLAVVVPFMPFVIWTMAMFTLMKEITLAVFALPFWAATHIVDGGEGLMGTAQKGYMELLSLIVRPSALVIGGVYSMKMMNVAGSVINEGFAGVYNLAVANDTTGLGLTIFAGSIIMYSYLHYQVVRKLTMAVVEFPDQVMHWFGGSNSDMSSPVREIEAGTAAAAGGTVAALKQNGGQSVTRLAQAMSSAKSTPGSAFKNTSTDFDFKDLKRSPSPRLENAAKNVDKRLPKK